MSDLGFSLLGLGGSGMVILAILYSAAIYRGTQQQKFSIFNHFISELGEMGISKGALVFNASLVIGGILLIPYIVYLGVLFQTLLGWLGVASGIITAGGVSAVGIFPMNNLKPHGHAAMTFFRGGLLMVLFFGLAILFQPTGIIVVPREAAFLSLVAMISFVTFLIMLSYKKERKQNENLDPGSQPERPLFWILPFLEWVVFFAIIFWCFGMAVLTL